MAGFDAISKPAIRYRFDLVNGLDGSRSVLY